MPGNKQPPSGKKYGPGTNTQGKIGDKERVPENTVVGRKEPPYEVTGLDALSPLLEHVDFPASRDKIEERIGHVEVPVDKTHTWPVRDILDKTSPTRFNSSGEVERAIQDVWDQIVPEDAASRGRGSQQYQGDNLSERPRRD